jgi:hypothetical protein
MAPTGLIRGPSGGIDTDRFGMRPALRLSALRRPERSRYVPLDLATDALIEGYVAWREASAEVHVAYARWVGCDRRDQRLASASYLAALDREDKAACVYERLIEVVIAKQT